MRAREQLIDALAEAFEVDRADVLLALYAIEQRNHDVRAMRQFMIEQCIEPVYRMWIAQAIASGAIADPDQNSRAGNVPPPSRSTVDTRERSLSDVGGRSR